MKRYILSLLFVSLTSVLQAGATWSAGCQQVYDDIFNLKFSSAQSQIAVLMGKETENLMVPYLSHYLDFLEVILGEDPDLLLEVERKRENLLALLSKDENPNSLSRFLEGEVNLQWAMLQLNMANYLSGALNARRAFKIYNELYAVDPDFLPLKKSRGLLLTALGGLPDDLQWVVNLTGMKGDVNQGFLMVEEFIRESENTPYSLWNNEAIFFDVLLNFNFTDKQIAFDKAMKHTESLPASHLCRIFIRGLIGMKSGNVEEALKAILYRPKGKEYFPFPHLDYLAGLGMLYADDPRCPDYLMTFLNNTSGPNRVKDAYLHLGYFYYLNGNLEKYQKAINNCLQRGDDKIDRDKQAMLEATLPLPDKKLLKARFLFDGGYYDRAIAEIPENLGVKFSGNQFTEFNYRRGRIFQRMDNKPEAIKAYVIAQQQPNPDGLYFQGTAALELGRIFESLGNKKLSSFYYSKCLSFLGFQYERGIKSKARAGLDRIEKIN
ncbi:MAG: hypothetical protein ACJATA_000308 [Sphingobacteriales bacterium]|jgi:hypothetical protein